MQRVQGRRGRGERTVSREAVKGFLVEGQASAEGRLHQSGRGAEGYRMSEELQLIGRYQRPPWPGRQRKQ